MSLKLLLKDKNIWGININTQYKTTYDKPSLSPNLISVNECSLYTLKPKESISFVTVYHHLKK